MATLCIDALLLNSAMGAELYTNPPLPVEGREFRIVYRAEAVTEGGVAAFRVWRQGGQALAEQAVPLLPRDGKLEAALPLTVPTNGLLLAEVTVGEAKAELTIPVLSAKREVNLIYYSMSKELLDTGHLRWVTLVTSCPENAVADLNQRGIKPLAWSWGSNYLSHKETELKQGGVQMSPQIARDVGRHLCIWGAAERVEKGYAGVGMDEFGGYAATDLEEQTREFVRGLLDARKDLPEGYILVAWHGGPIGQELMGLYKQAVDFLLPEAYLLHFVPTQLGTEIMVRDLEGRLSLARANDMFTAPYGTRCRIIPALDVTDNVPVSEYESAIRMIRREFPEVRGIAFFNSLSKDHWAVYRVLDTLCFDYYIRPVLTFQPDSLYWDRFATGQAVAWLSNIGAIDSGPATVRLLVDGQEVAQATVPTVPAGFSRADNRAAAHFAWKPEKSGTYRLRAELVEAGDATVLEPVSETALYLNR